MSANFQADSLDIVDGPYHIQKRLHLTSLYIKQHFGTNTRERNFEKVWDLFSNGKLQLFNADILKLDYAFESDEYKEALLQHIVSEPYSQKEHLPNWVKLINGQTISIKNNRISVTTTDMNFSNLEKFVHAILNLQKFYGTFMDREAKIEVDFSSVSVSNMKDYFQDNYFFDEFERQSKRYTFDINFNLSVTLKKAVTPNKSLKKYSQALNGINSRNYIQIICDALEYPGKFSYAPESQKIFLKPVNYEEACDYFVKRLNRSKRLNLKDFIEQSNHKSKHLFKLGHFQKTVKIEQPRAAFHYTNVLVFLDASYPFYNSNYKDVFSKTYHTIIDVCNAIEQFNSTGDATHISNLQRYFNNDRTVGSVYLNIKAFLKTNKQTQNSIQQIFNDFKDILHSASQVLAINTPEASVQTAFITYLRDKIALDPISYIDDKDEIISDFAKVLLSGI